MATGNYTETFHDNAVRAEITTKIVNMKANVCPMTIRLAWHASGTYDKSDDSGGSDGATMRFKPELTDGANAGLGLMQNVLAPIKKKFSYLSYADIWTLAGVEAVKHCGGPDVPFKYGRSDADPSSVPSCCPANGRLPDAALGADHLRDVFHRMGFIDQEIVVLSGAHTLGSCHESRSGFEGPWTKQPLKFDNEYFKNILEIEWKEREWDGPLQYTDPSGKLMMLPTDLALKSDPKFLPYVKKYAKDEALFAKDFAAAFGKLIALGCPAHVQPDATPAEVTNPESAANKDFRDLAMHGSLVKMKKIAEETPGVNASSKEAVSLRTPLHKAAYFGHPEVVKFLISEFKVDTNAIDAEGETPMHDAARFGHFDCVKVLLEAGADKSIKNNLGQSPHDVAVICDQDDVADALKKTIFSGIFSR